MNKTILIGLAILLLAGGILFATGQARNVAVFFGLASTEREKQIYWCPMHPFYKVKKYGICPYCNMELEVYTPSPGADEADPTLILTPQQVQQAGVRTEKVERRELVSEIETTGLVQLNREREWTIDVRFEGWVEELYINNEGDPVRKGDPIAKVYSNKLIAVQDDYLRSLAAGDPVRLESTRKRLELMGIDPEEMNRAITQPGMPNWFLMPIQTRIGMITTGMRGYLGLKIFGTDYERVEKLGIDLERILNEDVPGTVSAVADRAATGGYYLDVDIDQDACGRFNISTDEVERVIGTAIGGMPVTETIEGRYRFSVAVRYPREQRDDPEKLKRILVRLPGKDSRVVTLGQLASFELKRGPMVIKSENNLLVVYLPVEFEGMSLGEYVAGARKAILVAIEEKRVIVPAGYTTKWSGQYEIMEKANQRLLWIGVVTLFVIFVIIFLYFRKLSPTLIVMGGTLLFAPVGAVWLTWFLDYNTSTAWWLGVLLLMGLSAETGIIMLVYLENAYKELLKKHGKMTRKILDQAIEEGATQRVRPKVMTVATDILAVVPMLLAAGAGAATLQRMAAPLVGGLFTSLILTLLVIPAAYRIVRGWGLK